MYGNLKRAETVSSQELIVSIMSGEVLDLSAHANLFTAKADIDHRIFNTRAICTRASNGKHYVLLMWSWNLPDVEMTDAFDKGQKITVNGKTLYSLYDDDDEHVYESTACSYALIRNVSDDFVARADIRSNFHLLNSVMFRNMAAGTIHKHVITYMKFAQESCNVKLHKPNGSISIWPASIIPEENFEGLINTITNEP